MSLDADYHKIVDYKNVCYLPDDQLNPVTHALVFVTMSIGIGEITDKNWREFWLRARIAERVFGTFMSKPLMPDDVKSHIGLKTNVAPLSKVQFRTRIDHGLRAELDLKLARWEEENENVLRQLQESVHRPVPASGD